MGFSPDAVVQMAFQAAYYGLYGRMECVYEPAMTKAFFHGRTEAIRSVTNESTTFVKTFWGENPAQAKINALRNACERHSAITKDCSTAQGQDRHLYALFCVWQRRLDAEYAPSAGSSISPSSSPDTSISPRPSAPRMPTLFADNGWDRLNTTILSTSNCGNPSLRHFGFGPTSGDGFGIGYIIKDGSVSICASSKHRQTTRFVAAIEAYFIEVRKLLRQINKQSGTATKKTGSRAREIDDRPDLGGRMKSRGRVIGEKIGAQKEESPPSDNDDDGLGGCKSLPGRVLTMTLTSHRWLL